MHTMATCFGGMGVTPIKDSRAQEPHNISESESQDEDPFKQVLSKTAYIKQFMEEKFNEPREDIHKIEQSLNDLSLVLHHQNTPLENVLDRYTETFCTAQKKNLSGEFLITRYTHIKWARSFTTRRLANGYRNSLRTNWQR